MFSVFLLHLAELGLKTIGKTHPTLQFSKTPSEFPKFFSSTKPNPLFLGQYIGQPGVGNYQDKEDPIEYVDTKSNQRNYQIHDHHLNERQTFRASTYANDMMAGFKSLKDSRSLCDCILVAQNVQFHVHKELA